MIRILLSLVMVGSLYLGSLPALAADPVNSPRPLFTRSADPKVPNPEIGLPNLVKGLFSNDVTTENFIMTVAQVVINFLLLLAGLVAFFYVFYGGFRYLTAGADSGAADAGKKTVIGAVVGIAIVSLSYTVVRVIFQLINAQFNTDALTYLVEVVRWI